MEFLIQHGTKLTLLALGTLISSIIKYSWSAYQEKRAKKQQLFEDYSKRYSAIIANILSACKSFDTHFDKSNKEQVKNSLLLFMLLSEELALKQRKLIDDDIWDIWQSGIKFHMKTQYFFSAWIFLSKQMDFEGDFADLINSYISRNTDSKQNYFDSKEAA